MNAHAYKDKVETCNIEAEQQVLGCVLLNESALDAIENLKPDDFHEQIHRVFFEVMLEMRDADKTISPITMKPYIPEGEIGSQSVFQYLISLTSAVASPGNVRNYAQAVIETSVARQAATLAIELADQMPKVINGASVTKMISSAQERLEMLRERTVAAETRKSAADAFDGAVWRDRSKVENSFIPFPLHEMQAVLSEPGWTVGNLYGLLARSGEGKSSMTMQIIRHALDLGHPVIFFSYDQSPEQCTMQMAQQVHEIEMRRMQMQEISDKEGQRLIEFGGWLRRQSFEIVRCTNEGGVQIERMVKRFIASLPAGHRAPLVVIDHIKAVGLSQDVMKADEGTKAGAVTRPLKAMAGKHEVAVLLLNQRNSRGLSRSNPRPIAADLHGGEQARYDYDAVLTLYRPYIWKTERLASSGGSERELNEIERIFRGALEETAEIGSLKVRFGPPGVRRDLVFEGRFTRFHSGSKPETDEGEMLL